MLHHAYSVPGEPGASYQAGKGKPSDALKGTAGGCCSNRELPRSLHIIRIVSRDLQAEVKPSQGDLKSRIEIHFPHQDKHMFLSNSQGKSHSSTAGCTLANLCAEGESASEGAGGLIMR